ncbi:hypothetical protein M885DRAFT_497883 [Pelagophyceae sp. CCMP2097]|nr:hypothetical protein M885DRAFT_497883 [Pelagophyceae sp. CCMP2097]
MRLIFGLALAAWAARATAPRSVVVHERGVAARAVTTTTFSRFIGPQHFSLNCSNKTQVVKLRKASLCDAAALAKYDLKGKIVVSKLHWACEMEGQHRRLAKLGVALWLTKTKTTKMPSIHWNYHYRFIKWRADKAPPLLSVVERVGWRGVLAHGGHVVFEPDRNCWKDLFQSPLYQAVCRGLFGGGKAVGAALGCIAIRARLRNDAWLWLPLAALTLETLSLAILSALWLVGAKPAQRLHL